MLALTFRAADNMRNRRARILMKGVHLFGEADVS
jgi:hypothetical protein